MRDRGFSLIELLIVVAIILVIAAIAIPNFLHAKIRANEASAVSSIRAINTAQTTYIISYPAQGYADDLAKLGSPTGGGAVSKDNSGLLDWVLGCASQPCRKSGYKFSILNATGTPVAAYKTVGVPTDVGVTGERGFCSDRMNPVLADPAGGTSCTEPLR